MKREIVLKYAETDEDAILLANILDRHERCRDGGYITATGFLDLRQQGMTVKMEREFSEKHLLYGGYEDAERKMLMFFPDYATVDPAECMCVLDVRGSARGGLTHRDFLGSLMSLGIKRESTGDILVSDERTQIVVKREMADFLELNYNKAAHTRLECSIMPLTSLCVPKTEVREKTDTLATPRLDAACASAFSMSRGAAARLIEAKRVFVNDLLTEKCDKLLLAGDKIRIKGFGRAYLSEIGGKSRKGRIFVKFEIYK